MAPTPPLGPYVGMSDEEMRAFLKASCGVEDCDLHVVFPCRSSAIERVLVAAAVARYRDFERDGMHL